MVPITIQVRLKLKTCRHAKKSTETKNNMQKEGNKQDLVQANENNID